MAGMEIEFPENLLSELFNGSSEELCIKMIEEATPIMEESMKHEVQAVIGHGGDSDLVRSIKASKVKKAKNGAYIAEISPTGNSKNFYYAGEKRSRKEKVSNVLKAVWLNYGRKGQPAKPFLTKAKNKAENAAIQKMQEVYNNMTKGGSE